MSSRHNGSLPQHRGINSGGTLPTGQAKSPKYGGHGKVAPKNYAAMTVAQLRAEAKSAGLRGFSRWRKAQLVAALTG
jgi:hypothetical protein